MNIHSKIVGNVVRAKLTYSAKIEKEFAIFSKFKLSSHKSHVGTDRESETFSNNYLPVKKTKQT